MLAIARFLPVLLLLCLPLFATIFGNLRGIVHDPQHRPISGAQVTLHAARSNWQQQATTTEAGEFRFTAVPIGEYNITIAAPGFSTQTQTLLVRSNSESILHIALSLERAQASVEVSAPSPETDVGSTTTATTINREQIAHTPGADRTNSLAMITDNVPGAFVIHNELHIRGGHAFEWLLDGVPVPNTNLSSNVGPQFDPKDIDYMEVQRGGFSAEYGGRSYGVFDVVTRNGFERDRQGELAASYGNLHTTDNQINFGDHNERGAYYASVSGNRSDLGLETPTPEVLHDQEAGGSAFASFIFNKTPSDQLRLVTALRGDHYQVPNTPEQQQAGIRDVDDERDAFANFSWVHTYSSDTLLTLSPFYHFNRAHYIGGPQQPISPESDRGSNYVGGVITLAATRGRHHARAGVQGFAQRDNTLFALRSADANLRSSSVQWGQVESLFVEDQYRATNWLTFTGGLRLTHFSGALTEHALDPRLGASVRIPRLNWVVRAFYGRNYQPPPLLSVGGPVLELAATQGFGFLPLKGERDRQYEAGLNIPLRGWTGEFSYFQTSASNFFDHDALGNSNIFFPLTIERALIRGWEATIRSPKLPGGAKLNLVYARQMVQGRGAVTGGLTDFAAPDAGWFFLDHDQRNTASAVATMPLPWDAQISGVAAYGSGFLDGDGPAHLPAHTTLDLALGKSFGERLSLQLAATNVTNRRYLLDNSNSFGGTHFVNPRLITAQLKYRFRY
jgi:outer membrane receptor protein involved in Fe transport